MKTKQKRRDKWAEDRKRPFLGSGEVAIVVRSIIIYLQSGTVGNKEFWGTRDLACALRKSMSLLGLKRYEVCLLWLVWPYLGSLFSPLFLLVFDTLSCHLQASTLKKMQPLPSSSVWSSVRGRCQRWTEYKEEGVCRQHQLQKGIDWVNCYQGSECLELRTTWFNSAAQGLCI